MHETLYREENSNVLNEISINKEAQKRARANRYKTGTMKKI